ncbi:adenine nucleotide alpha hydrolases-like protein [Xylaria sp. CBS 124048]|nr:adenine nucleotide alpha hydrolases-like protein [Xylaria sp. CBS 124048]
MGTLSYPVTAGARPIAIYEFAEALRAISPPRFPTARGLLSRPVGLAVSGGVDSMALAYLCCQLRSYDPDFKVSDNPISYFRGFIIDHQLREESTQEAWNVKRTLSKMGLTQNTISTISWTKILAEYGPQYTHQSELPNVETFARRLRYQAIGRMAANRRMASVLLAHHEDDQYETVLMRLLQGHGMWGLRGMKPASDIPECEGIHGAYQSGYIDDQENNTPFYNNRVSRRQYKAIKAELRSSISLLMEKEEFKDPMVDKLDLDLREMYHTNHVIVDADTVDAEDGGVMIYRPLLGFSKDRLIATCEANGVSWVEDSTNHDPTLTMRNAVRSMYKSYTLPAALQKPAILALSQRCERKAQALEAEANRLLTQTIIHDIESNVGTATVQFPEYSLSRFPRDVSSRTRRHARILRQRDVVGCLLRRIIAIVSPETQTVPLSSLQDAISRLFPALSDVANNRDLGPPKAFVIAGVHFVPIESPSNKSSQSPQRSARTLTWYLSRTPYPANLPLPRVRPPYWFRTPMWGECKARGRSEWCRWRRWCLWDGRFWVRTRHRFPYRVVVLPFLAQHAKAFRELLTPEDRSQLAAVLKRYAPGKTRFTLPALYIEEHLDLTDVRPRRFYPLSHAQIISMNLHEKHGLTGLDPQCEHPRVPNISKMKLICLPSLDIQIPHLEDWLEYEVRFRRIDRTTISTAGSFHRGSFLPRYACRLVPLSVAQLRRRRPRGRRKL